LGHRLGGFAGKTVLDAFAGTGALGLEALSRGATSAIFIDKDRKALALARRNAETLGLPSGRVSCWRIQRNRRRLRRPATWCCSTRLMAKGWRDGRWRPLHGAGWLAPGALVVIEAETGAAGGDPGGIYAAAQPGLWANARIAS